MWDDAADAARLGASLQRGGDRRVGQKGSLAYLWARKGSHPAVLRDQRHASAYLFGAVCPARDLGVALVLAASSAPAPNVKSIPPRRRRDAYVGSYREGGYSDLARSEYPPSL